MNVSKDKYLGWSLLVMALLALVLVFALARQPDFDDDYEPVLPAVSSGLPENLDYESIEEVYDLVRLHFDGPLDHETLVTGIKKGLVEAVGDPHSEYLDVSQTEALEELLTGEFEGIGIEITDRDGFLTIVAPIDGSPALEAGLQAEDIILEIDGQPTGQMTLSQAVSLIRGPAGTVVSLKIHREGSEPNAFSVTRALIDIPSVSWRAEEGIAIIRISNFDNDTAALMAEAATEIIDQNLEGVVLDLRSNPGGLVDQVLAVAGFWLEEDQVVVKYYVGGQSDAVDRVSGVPELAVDQPAFANWPTVVLINSASASASEILAGALQDSGQATLIGETSFGKGSAQDLIKLGEGPEAETLKLTISRFHTPGGRQIDGVGLTPDIILVNPDEPEGGGEPADLQLQEAKLLIKRSNAQN